MRSPYFKTTSIHLFADRQHPAWSPRPERQHVPVANPPDDGGPKESWQHAQQIDGGKNEGDGGSDDQAAYSSVWIIPSAAIQAAEQCLYVHIGCGDFSALGLEDVNEIRVLRVENRLDLWCC